MSKNLSDDRILAQKKKCTKEFNPETDEMQADFEKKASGT